MKVKFFMKTLLLRTFLSLITMGSCTLVHAQETYKYYFIQSIEQHALGCGYYALANAHAVQQLFNEGKEINEANIKKLAKESLLKHFTDFYKNMYDELSVEAKNNYDNDFLKYAESQTDLLSNEASFSYEDNRSTFFTILSNEHNKLENAYAIQYIGDQNQPNIIRIAECVHNDTNGSFIGTIKNQEKAIIHFLYNLGSYESGHWVYVGVIKEPGKLPYIIHLNSKNNDSFYTSTEFKVVIQHVVDCIHNQTPLVIDNEQIHALSPEAIKAQEQIDIEKAIKESLEENELKLAQKLQEEEDFAYSKMISEQEENDYSNDASIALALALEEEEKNKQIAEDADFAYALSLADEYDF